MARKVTPSPAALRDLDNIKGWLRQPGAGAAAKAKLTNIRNSIKQLKKTPARWSEVDHPGVREIPVDGYRVMYDVDPDTGDNETAGDVRVLRVFGPGQDRSSL